MPETMPKPDSTDLWRQLTTAAKWGRRLLMGMVIAGLLVLVVELVRIYGAARDISPWLGYASIVAMCVGASFIIYPAYKFLRLPRVVQPPAVPPPELAEPKHFKAEVAYLDRYLSACGRNPLLNEKYPLILELRTELKGLQLEAQRLTKEDLKAFDAKLTDWTRTHMTSVLKEIDAKTDRVIYEEALTVGLATAASPNGTLDAFVMLWRSVQMVSRIGTLYYGRPGLWGTAAICRDVSVAVALAGYMQSVSDSLGGLLAKSVGGVGGVVAGPAVDGITNSLVLIRIGYLAKQRCRSFRHWDARTRQWAVADALASTRNVAFGITTEIVRRVGVGLRDAAGVATQGAIKVAGHTFGNVSRAAESAADAVRQAASVVKDQVRAAGNTIDLVRRRTQPKTP